MSAVSFPIRPEISLCPSFSVDVENKTHELPCWQKVVIVALGILSVGIVGLALSYYWRNRLVDEIYAEKHRKAQAVIEDVSPILESQTTATQPRIDSVNEEQQRIRSAIKIQTAYRRHRSCLALEKLKLNAVSQKAPSQNEQSIGPAHTDTSIVEKIASTDLLRFIISYLSFQQVSYMREISHRFEVICIAYMKVVPKLELMTREIHQVIERYRKIEPSKPLYPKLKELHLYVTGSDIESVYKIECFTAIKKLTISTREDIDKPLKVIIPRLQFLEHLILENRYFKGEYFGRSDGDEFYDESDFEAIATSQSLTHLSIGLTGLMHIEPLAKLTQLKTLNLAIEMDSLDSVDEYSMDKRAIDILNNMPVNKTLALSKKCDGFTVNHDFSQWDEELLIYLFKQLGQDINEVEYDYPQIVSSQRLLACLAGHSLNRCEALSICPPEFLNQDMGMDMRPFLNLFPNLEVIAVRCMNFNQCFNMRNLKKLALFEVIVCEGFWTDFLSNFSEKLQVLRLRGVKLADKDMIPILKQGRFTELDLSGTLITDETLFTIAETQTELLKLNLYANVITLKGIDSLACLAKLQKIIISSYLGEKYSLRERPKNLDEVADLIDNPCLF